MSDANPKRPLLQHTFCFQYVWQEDDSLEVHLKTEGEVFSFDGVYARIDFEKALEPTADEKYALFRYGMPVAYMGSAPRHDLRCQVSNYGLVLGVINEEAYRSLHLSYPSNNLSVVDVSWTQYEISLYQDCKSVYELKSTGTYRNCVALIDGYTDRSTLEHDPDGHCTTEQKKTDLVQYHHDVLVKQLGIKFDVEDVRETVRGYLACGETGIQLGIAVVEFEKDRVTHKLLLDGLVSDDDWTRRKRNTLNNALQGRLRNKSPLHFGHLTPVEGEPKTLTLNGYRFVEMFKDLYVFVD